MQKKPQPVQHPTLNHDPLEDDPTMQAVLELAGDEAHAELAAQGWVQGFGYGREFELAKKRILKTKYQIEWKTFKEMNPGWIFD